MRDRILRGELKENETDNKNLRRFLWLLERPKSSNEELSNYNAITEDKWKEVIKKSKKKSILLIYSKRIYLVCKIMLESKRMTAVLIWFYNVVIKEEIVLD